MANIRGGKLIQDDLNSSYDDIDAYVEDARKYLYSNPRLVEKILGNIEFVTRESRRQIKDVLAPMLEKRDQRAAADLRDVLARLADLESRMVTLERSGRAVRDAADLLADLQQRIQELETFRARQERAPVQPIGESIERR